MNTDIFRAYDIRGKYPTEINEDLAYTLGRSYGSYIQEKNKINRCVISRDNRLSSESLCQSFVKGLNSTGCNAIDYGQTTTPMNLYARYLNHLPGVMITASHNPKDDNGFKMSFDSNVLNARGEMITDFKNYTLAGKFLKGDGRTEHQLITEKYIEYLKYSIKFGAKRRKVIFDCGNGITALYARKIFNNFNIDFEIINEQSDGNFPHHHPDPAVRENMKELQEAVVAHKADLGIAFDGDGDRLGVVLETGELMPIEHYIILMIRDMIGSVQNKTFLYDVKCSKAIEDEIKRLGAVGICYRTGASYTQAKVLEDNLPFGAEYSGHIFFRDRVNDVGSAFYAALRLLEVLSKNPEKLSIICSDIPRYFITDEIKIPTTEALKPKIIEAVKNYCIQGRYPINEIDGIRVNFTNGWALVRASNTGSNIIFRAEAVSSEGLQILQNMFIPLINNNNK